MNMTTSISKHVAHYCGTPAQSWADPTTGILVGRYDNVPDLGMSTFITAGLSAHVFEQAASCSKISQELLCTIDSKYRDLPFNRVLLATASLLVDIHAPVQQGQVLGPFGLIFPECKGCSLVALYCGFPAFFEDAFQVIDSEPPTVFVELFPLSESDLALIKRDGAEAFERAVDLGNIDILNLER